MNRHMDIEKKPLKSIVAPGRAPAAGLDRGWRRGCLLTPRTYVCDSAFVTGDEFLRRVKKLARRAGRTVTFVASHGKGSHGRLYVGSSYTTLKDRKKEIGTGLLHSMCADLEIDPSDL